MTAAAVFGKFISGLRTQRCVSLRQLADQASVARRTLSYWEAGMHLPHLPELEAVLAVLSATPAERAEALALLGTPRAVQRLEEQLGLPSWESRLGPLPAGGDLLRAMRRRKRLSLEQAAQRMAVAPSTLSRWEQGRVVPPPEQLAVLLVVLGASPSEAAALHNGLRFLALPLRDAVGSPEALHEAFRVFHSEIFAHREDKLNDLRFLTYLAEAWFLAVDSESGRHVLADMYAHYASYLIDFQRYAEAGQAAERSLTLLSARSATGETALRASLAAAHSSVYQGLRTSPAVGIAALRPWLDRPQGPAFQGWVRANLAEYLMLGSAMEAALEMSAQACRAAERCDDPNELRLRRLDRAKLLVRAEDAEQGLSLVVEYDQDTPFRRADVRLVFAEGLLALGDGAGAQSWLARASADIAAGELDHLRARADALARRL
jgi:transcriptional regulator with XRE-family HTH domain